MLAEMLQARELVSELKIGLLTGVGIAATNVSTGYMYTKTPVGLHLIDGLYHAGPNVIAAIILVAPE
jgi:hypothetical protein